MRTRFKSILYSTAISSTLLLGVFDAHSSQYTPRYVPPYTQQYARPQYAPYAPQQARPQMGDLDRQLLDASRAGNKDLIERLIAQRANLNARDQNGDTPLHLAARGGNSHAAEILLVQGGKMPMPLTIDVNAVNGGGATPLHWAAMNGDVDTVKILLNYGANINAEAASRKTPLDYAIDNQNTQAADYLRSKGAISTFYTEAPPTPVTPPEQQYSGRIFGQEIPTPSGVTQPQTPPAAGKELPSEQQYSKRIYGIIESKPVTPPEKQPSERIIGGEEIPNPSRVTQPQTPPTPVTPSETPPSKRIFGEEE